MLWIIFDFFGFYLKKCITFVKNKTQSIENTEKTHLFVAYVNPDLQRSNPYPIGVD